MPYTPAAPIAATDLVGTGDATLGFGIEGLRGNSLRTAGVMSITNTPIQMIMMGREVSFGREPMVVVFTPDGETVVVVGRGSSLKRAA